MGYTVEVSGAYNGSFNTTDRTLTGTAPPEELHGQRPGRQQLWGGTPGAGADDRDSMKNAGRQASCGRSLVPDESAGCASTR